MQWTKGGTLHKKEFEKNITENADVFYFVCDDGARKYTNGWATCIHIVVVVVAVELGQT